MKDIKTNAMRILERHHIEYRPVYYDLGEEEFSGLAVSARTGVPAEQNFKTLAAQGDKRGMMVFLIPVHAELDLKLAAAVAGDKKVELVPVKELLALTGYVRGEVSPVGMKKSYPTFIDASALKYAEILVSAGKKGASLSLAPQALEQLLNARFVDLLKR